jgi:hypothetical protein
LGGEVGWWCSLAPGFFVNGRQLVWPDAVPARVAPFLGGVS